MPLINYVRRKSENLSTAIESIYGLKVDGAADKGLQIASETFTEMLGFDLQKALNLKLEDFMDEVLKNNFSLSFLELFCQFISDTADIYKDLKENDKAENLYNKSVLLLKYITQNDKTYSLEREERIGNLEEKLNIK